MMENKSYYYLIAFTHQTGYGSVTLSTNEKLDTVSAVTNAGKDLEAINGFQNVAIMNIIELKGL